VSEGIVIALIGFFGVVTPAIFGYLMTRHTKSMNKQTEQNAAIGKLRIKKESIWDRHDAAMNRFVLFFAGCYANGNDRDKVAAELGELTRLRDKTLEENERINSQMMRVYEGKEG
jgi:uncharacterized protein YneF (UPF0154 family)